MKKILVPTDFSPSSRAAFKFAIDLASKAHAEVCVIHMNKVPLLPETTFGIQPNRWDADELEKVNDAANKAYVAMRREFPSSVPVYFSTINDEVVSGIQEYSEDNDIDLIIMSTHGASDLEQFFIGSTAEKVARFSAVPVMSIPKAIDADHIKSIVFPNSLRLDQHELVKDLKELQNLLGAQLHVLLVNTPLNFYSEQYARKNLQQFAAYYDLKNFTLNFRSHQFERNGILEFMNEIKADMIAMATHGRTGLAHFFKGSIAEEVINRIDHPIWTWNLKKHNQE